jgi:hypothetical protein
MKKMNCSNLTVSISRVYEISHEAIKLGTRGKGVATDMTLLKKYFSMDEKSIILLTPIIFNHFNGESTSFRDLRMHFDMPALLMLEYQDLLDQMVDKGIISNQYDHRISDVKSINSNYQLTPAYAEAIAEKRLPEKQETIACQTALDLLENIWNTIDKSMDSRTKKEVVIKRFVELIDSNKHIGLVSEVRDLGLPQTEEIMLCCLFWKSLESNGGIDLNSLAKLAGNEQQKVLFKQSILNSSNPLISKELVFLTTDFMNEISLCLTSTAAELLKSSGLVLSVAAEAKKQRILPEMIAEKQLIYNEHEKDQIVSLESILHDENYHALRSRLSGLNLPVGLNVLLFGAPGTGKTETVYQLARQTGREIIRVEISQTKSKWFGESEKNIKEIFTNYASVARGSSKMPILLFNEADAILSNRNPMNMSGTGQTENAMQNILLEELEKFDGIFFATTNLAQNLDKAFDRRFLYKVEFAKPGISQRVVIIGKKLPFLDSDSCKMIADQFDLSGGQIENIARKSEIFFIMHGKTPDAQKIISFCHEEMAVNPVLVKKQIGFGR